MPTQTDYDTFEQIERYLVRKEFTHNVNRCLSRYARDMGITDPYDFDRLLRSPDAIRILLGIRNFGRASWREVKVALEDSAPLEKAQAPSLKDVVISLIDARFRTLLDVEVAKIDILRDDIKTLGSIAEKIAITVNLKLPTNVRALVAEAASYFNDRVTRVEAKVDEVGHELSIFRQARSSFRYANIGRL